MSIEKVKFATEALLRDDLINKVNLIIDGLGEGSNIGFIDYNDTSSPTTPVALQAGVWTTLPNDGAGAFTNKGYTPEGVTELMQPDGTIDCTQLELGDSILIRNDYKVFPNINNGLLEFRYVLGAGAGEYALSKNLGRLDDGSGREYHYSLNTDFIYMGDLNTLNNPISLQAKLSVAGTVINAGSAILIIKRRD